MYRRTLAVTLIAIVAAAISCSRDPQTLKVKYVANGDKFVREKNYAEAVIEYRKAIALDGSYGEARLKLGTVYETSGDVRNALAEYVRAADLMPNSVDAQVRAGSMLLYAGQYPEAKARAAAALAKDPRNTGAKRLAEKVGMQCEGQLRQHLYAKGEWCDCLFFGLLRTPASRPA